MSADPRVAIIGGGFGGIAISVRLKQLGIHSFVVFEANSGPGGTWWSNRYPGSEVDVPSSIYSFSFMPYPWTRTHVQQPELLDYVWRIMRDFDLTPHFRFDTRVTSVVWDEGTREYTVASSAGEERFDVVVSAVGLLSNPRYPEWEGMDDYRGHFMHSSRWDDSIPMAGRTVAVVGTGASAAQIIPTIAPGVEQLYVFQREPGWVLPKHDRTYSVDERLRRGRPLRRRLDRIRGFLASERVMIGGQIYREGSRRHAEGKRIALSYLDDVFRDRPELRESLTPRYSFSGKRRVLSDLFYPALLRENVTLVTEPVVAMSEAGVIDRAGVEYDVDVVVAATGFTASDMLATIEVTGRGGRSLRHEWRDGAFAFLGLTVPGFPNFYMLYGPNTNGGAPVTYMHEQEADFIARDVLRLRKRPGSQIEVSRRATERFNVWLQKRLQSTAWAKSNNYMKAASGRIVTQWPEGALLYTVLLRTLRVPSSKLTVDPAAAARRGARA
jgi:cation diffusion facilitator CzcD-associated flavoprotein CzcO